MYTPSLLVLILMPIAVEAATEIFTKSKLFEFIQVWAEVENSFLKKLVSCPYCVSVWVAFGFWAIYWLHAETVVIIAVILVTHRLSNLFHHFQEIVYWGATKLKESNGTTNWG